MSDRDLLLVALGPVQDFIATARRCQDLWFGSWLLSSLSRAAAKSIEQVSNAGDVLVFPPNVNSPDTAVANKILARVPSGAAADIAERARQAVQSALRAHAEDAFNLPAAAQKYLERKRAMVHLDELIEYIWVSVPEAGNYAGARGDAEELLARRKFTKGWAQAPGDDAMIPKSSLDGARESVIHERAFDELADEELHRYFRVKRGERLCGVGLLKRLGYRDEVDNAEYESDEPSDDQPTFHSTSHVAGLPIWTRAVRREAFNEVREYVDAIKANAGLDVRRLRIPPGAGTHAVYICPLSGASTRVPRTVLANDRNGYGYDAVLFFDEAVKSLLEEIPTPVASDSREQKLAVSKAWHGLRKQLECRDEPCPYYAYLLADGDRMGAALDAVKDFTGHQAVSAALEGFAGECEKIVAGHLGSLVYSGGDDVLALLPLHTALACARALRDAFSAHLDPVFEGLGVNKIEVDGRPVLPTLSVGLGVVHHKDPMSHAREMAKKAEKLAKNSGRDALAIVVDKRSGGTLEVARAWSDTPEALDRSIDVWARLLDSEALPDRAAFGLEDVPRVFETVGLRDPSRKECPHHGVQSELKELPSGSAEFVQRNRAVVSLARQVLKRKRAQGGSEVLDESTRGHVEDRLKLIEARETSDARLGLRELAHEIQMARLFLQAWRDAGGAVPRPKSSAQRHHAPAAAGSVEDGGAR